LEIHWGFPAQVRILPAARHLFQAFSNFFKPGQIRTLGPRTKAVWLAIARALFQQIGMVFVVEDKEGVGVVLVVGVGSATSRDLWLTQLTGLALVDQGVPDTALVSPLPPASGGRLPTGPGLALGDQTDARPDDDDHSGEQDTADDDDVQNAPI